MLMLNIEETRNWTLSGLKVYSTTFIFGQEAGQNQMSKWVID